MSNSRHPSVPWPTASLQQAIFDSLRLLPVQQQQSVLDFIEFLRDRFTPASAPLKSLKGLWSDLELDLAEADFSQARQEMWSGFGDNVEP
jgi:hypothetical protein